jgi:hypothetical protein
MVYSPYLLLYMSTDFCSGPIKLKKMRNIRFLSGRDANETDPVYGMPCGCGIPRSGIGRAPRMQGALKCPLPQRCLRDGAGAGPAWSGQLRLQRLTPAGHSAPTGCTSPYSRISRGGKRGHPPQLPELPRETVSPRAPGCSLSPARPYPAGSREVRRTACPELEKIEGLRSAKRREGRAVIGIWSAPPLTVFA